MYHNPIGSDYKDLNDYYRDQNAYDFYKSQQDFMDQQREFMENMCPTPEQQRINAENKAFAEYEAEKSVNLRRYRDALDILIDAELKNPEYDMKQYPKHYELILKFFNEFYNDNNIKEVLDYRMDITTSEDPIKFARYCIELRKEELIKFYKENGIFRVLRIIIKAGCLMFFAGIAIYVGIHYLIGY